jgi:hypothetical protein
MLNTASCVSCWRLALHGVQKPLGISKIKKITRFGALKRVILYFVLERTIHVRYTVAIRQAPHPLQPVCAMAQT